MKTINKTRNIKPKVSRSTKNKYQKIKNKKNKGKKSRKNPRK
jgi:hypothetical protein